MSTERELEKERKAILNKVDNFLSDIDYRSITDKFYLFIHLIHEYLKIQEEINSNSLFISEIGYYNSIKTHFPLNHKKRILNKVDNVLSDINSKEILENLSMFIDLIHECLRLQERKDYEALNEIYRNLIESIISNEYKILIEHLSLNQIYEDLIESIKG